jgi:hypothetical protein
MNLASVKARIIRACPPGSSTLDTPWVRVGSAKAHPPIGQRADTAEAARRIGRLVAWINGSG